MPHDHAQANAIGRSAKSVREFLEKNYKEEDMDTDELVLKLAVRALLEVPLNYWVSNYTCSIAQVTDQEGISTVLSIILIGFI